MTSWGNWWFVAGLAATVAAASAMVYWPLPTVLLFAAAAFMWLAIVPARGLYLLFTFLFLVPVTIDLGLPLDPVTLVFAPLILISVIGGTRRYLETRQVGHHKLPGLLIVAVAIAITSLINWPGFNEAQVAIRPYVVLVLVVWHVVAEAKFRPQVFLKAVRFILWASVPVAILAVYQRATGTWPILDDYAVRNFHSFEGQNRSAGVMGHPIIYGIFCMALIIISFVRRPPKWPLFFLANILGLILTGARSAWLAVAIALIFWYLTHNRKISGKGVAALWAAGIAAIAVIIVTPKFIQNIMIRLTSEDALLSAEARVTRIDVALSQINDSFTTMMFGHGPGAFGRFFQSGGGIGDGLAQTFDNSYLLFWYDYGLLALLPLVIFLMVGIFRRGKRTGRLLILAFTISIGFFDFFNWPVAVGILALGFAFRAAEVPDEPKPEMKAPARPVLATRTIYAKSGRSLPPTFQPGRDVLL